MGSLPIDNISKICIDYNENQYRNISKYIRCAIDSFMFEIQLKYTFAVTQ